MKILVTGAQGFIGRNLVLSLENSGYDILSFTREDTLETLNQYTQECELVFHLAGVNRSNQVSDFYEVNTDLTRTLVHLLKLNQNLVPIVFASSIHAGHDSDFGRSKKMAEDLLFEYTEQTETPVYIYQLPNLYGKWSTPFYNSVVATWCHQISRDLPIEITNPETQIEFAYIDDVINQFAKHLNGALLPAGYYPISVTDTISLGELSLILKSFKASRLNNQYPDVSTDFKQKLYATYLSYLPTDQFSYPLNMKEDVRGSFTEILKSNALGQISVNISKPGITKGQHWHHSKNEKFLVVYGQGIIRFRHLFGEEIIEYHVSGDKLVVVDIPPGYTHNIENIGSTDLVTLMWANEVFDPEQPDTYYLEV